jgi:hydroxymethylglutaryl-CoA lyase
MKIIESPREGMQGFSGIIPAAAKVKFINALLRVGFDTVEVGSIVSPKVIPQMADSLEVIRQLDLDGIVSNRMVLVVNRKGAEIAAGTDEITHISYPFSFSPTFLRMNVNSNVEQSFDTTRSILELCEKHGKEPVIYISYAYGNPYGDPWSMEMLLEWTGALTEIGVRTIPLSNVSQELSAEMIHGVMKKLVENYPETDFGLHLHTDNASWEASVNAAWEAGVRRFDGVINGWGGCPMAGKKMLGNLKTENLISFAASQDALPPVDAEALRFVYQIAAETYNTQ